MKKKWMAVLFLGLAAAAWGHERPPRLPGPFVPRWGRHRVIHWRRPRTPFVAVYTTYRRHEPAGYYTEYAPGPYTAWVSNSPGFHTTSLGPGGTIGSFDRNDPADTAHWYRYWLGPGEAINWSLSSSNPAVSKYDAGLFEYLDGNPGRLLAQARNVGGTQKIAYQNGPSGNPVFLRVAQVHGNASDDYALWGIGAAPRDAPVFLSQFALNGALQSGNEVVDGVEAEMVTGRSDDWYYWDWPEEINGQPVAAIKLNLAFDSSRIDLDLYAVSPLGDTILARTDGMHYTVGSGWLCKETGWIHRPPGDTAGLWLHVHTTRDLGKNQVYRINNAQGMTPTGVQIVYPSPEYTTVVEESYWIYPDWGGYESHYGHYRHGDRPPRGRPPGERPPPPPPPPPPPNKRPRIADPRNLPKISGTGSDAGAIEAPSDRDTRDAPSKQIEKPKEVDDRPKQPAPKPEAPRTPTPQPKNPSGDQGGSSGGSRLVKDTPPTKTDN